MLGDPLKRLAAKAAETPLSTPGPGASLVRAASEVVGGATGLGSLQFADSYSQGRTIPDALEDAKQVGLWTAAIDVGLRGGATVLTRALGGRNPLRDVNYSEVEAQLQKPAVVASKQAQIAELNEAAVKAEERLGRAVGQRAQLEALETPPLRVVRHGSPADFTKPCSFCIIPDYSMSYPNKLVPFVMDFSDGTTGRCP